MKHDTPKLKNRKCRGGCTRHDAFTLIETLIALAFLAVAAGMVVKVHRARMDFERQATNQLADQLNMENIAERLSLVEYADLPDESKRLAEEFKTTIEIDPFESEIGKGRHIQISLESAAGSMPIHLWKWEPKS